MKKNRMDRRIESFKDKGGALKIGTTVTTSKNWFGLYETHFPDNKDVRALGDALRGKKK